MAAPLSPERRAKLERDLKRRKGTPSVRDYAKKHGVSPETVTRYAKALGVDFGDVKRMATINATKALEADSRARLQRLRMRLLDEADRFVDALHEPHRAYNFGGRDNTYAEVMFDEPDRATQRILIINVASIIDKVAMIEKLHNPGSAENARDLFAAWLATVIEPVGEYDPVAVS